MPPACPAGVCIKCKTQQLRYVQKNYFIGSLPFLNAMVCVLTSKKKLTINFAGKSTKKAIYKMAAITECEIL